MNREICRRHCWLPVFDEGCRRGPDRADIIDEVCILCGVGDPHRHCYQDRHRCPWYEPLEHDRPREGSR